MSFFIYLPILICVLTFSVRAQDNTFQCIYGGGLYDSGVKSFPADDGGFFVIGNTSSLGAGNNDILFVRTDSMGKPVWQKTYGTSEVDHVSDVCRLNETVLVLNGYTNRNQSTGYDLLLMAIDTSGVVLWEKTYGGSDWDIGYCIMKDSGGFVIAAGQTYGDGFNSNFYYLKANASGDTLWTKTYGISDAQSISTCLSVNTNRYLFAGTVNNDGQNDILYLMTDSSGLPVWSQIYGDTLDEGIYSLANYFPDNLIYGAGFSKKDTGRAVGLLLITDTSGNVPYVCGSGYWNEDKDFYLRKVYIDTDGYINIGAFSEKYGLGKGDFLIYKFGFPCEYIYGRTVGGTEEDVVNDLYSIEGKYFIMTGTTESFNNLFSSIYFVKTDSLYFTQTAISDYTVSARNINVISYCNVYPSPSKDYINLHLGKPFVADVEITNLIGNVEIFVKNFSLPDSVDVRKLKPGLYFCKVQSNKQSFFFKFIKE